MKKNYSYEEFFYKEYGMKSLSWDEEMALPAAAHATRNNKIKMVDDLRRIRRSVEALEDRVRTIPVEDDEHHAQLVQELSEEIEKLRIAAEKVW